MISLTPLLTTYASACRLELPNLSHNHILSHPLPLPLALQTPRRAERQRQTAVHLSNPCSLNLPCPPTNPKKKKVVLNWDESCIAQVPSGGVLFSSTQQLGRGLSWYITWSTQTEQPGCCELVFDWRRLVPVMCLQWVECSARLWIADPFLQHRCAHKLTRPRWVTE